MEAIMDFAKAALPWIAIGLFVAFSAVRQQAKKQGKKLKGILNAGYFVPAAIFIVVAIVDWMDGNRNVAMTWLVLAGMNFMLAYANRPVGEGNFFKEDGNKETAKESGKKK